MISCKIAPKYSISASHGRLIIRTPFFNLFTSIGKYYPNVIVYKNFKWDVKRNYISFLGSCMLSVNWSLFRIRGNVMFVKP